GSARADLADFVDRSTLPWHRQVDLLVVPTSDTADVAGAIGLIQHGTVRAVALLASPDDDPAWALLRDEATRHHVPLTVLTGRQQIALAPGSTLVLDAGIADDPSRPGPMAVLEDGTASVVFTDWPASLFSANVPPVTPPPGHVLVSLRPDTPFGTVHNQVLLRPEPTSTATVRPAAGTYVGDVAPGRPITLTLSRDQIRAPVGALKRVAG
ncbi:MAG TPA: hypothetical protein VFN57_11760, partial [Thermomicrobiaceae bacterium]|nr:hypothetical protein [Thermomicrobiaceae bacterium]